jgi:hypothetical protein
MSDKEQEGRDDKFENEEEDEFSEGSEESDELHQGGRWGHFDDENDEVNETVNALVEDFFTDNNVEPQEDPDADDKYLQEHWAELMEYVSKRYEEFAPCCAGVALRLARRGIYTQSDEGTIPKPPLIKGFPDDLRTKALKQSEDSLEAIKDANSEESLTWENLELRRACLGMEIHLFSNGKKPAPENFQQLMDKYLQQREQPPPESASEEDEEAPSPKGGTKRSRSDDEDAKAKSPKHAKH